MKIIRKFLDLISLSKIPDAADNSRTAVTTGTQTFSGAKTFDSVRVPSPAAGQNKALVNLTDLKTALVDGPLITETEVVTLTAEQVSAKSVTLKSTYVSGMARLKLKNSGWFFSGVSFSITGTALSWDGFPELTAKLAAGDELYINYPVKRA